MGCCHCLPLTWAVAIVLRVVFLLLIKGHFDSPGTVLPLLWHWQQQVPSHVSGKIQAGKKQEQDFMSGMGDGERREGTEGAREKAAVEEQGAEIEPEVTASIMETAACSLGCGCLQLANSTDTPWNAKGEEWRSLSASRGH